jgi:hypothetical protein
MAETTANERLEKIADACSEKLEKQLGEPNMDKSNAVVVKDVGEALKALADGLESYKRATTTTIRFGPE